MYLHMPLLNMELNGISVTPVFGYEIFHLTRACFLKAENNFGNHVKSGIFLTSENGYFLC